MNGRAIFDLASSADLQALHFFLPRRSLRRASAGGKSRDEFIQLRDFLFALRVLRFDARANRRLGHHHVVVAAVVHDHRLVIDVGRVRANAVQKMAVVRDHDQHAFVIAQIFLQPVHRIEVQVVGRLVQQQNGRLAEERLRQQHAHFLPALQIAHRPLVQRIIHIQAVEQDAGVGLGGVAILIADDRFELGETHSVVVRQFVVRLRVQRVALLQRLPERRVSHDYRIDHAEFVERELILPQNAQFFRPRDRPLRRLELPGHDFHERGFSRAVGPGDGVAPAVKKCAGDVFEENSFAEAHRDVIERNQAQ